MIRETLVNLSGKRPSSRGAESIERWILPGEPIEGALAGHVGYLPAWYILTPTNVLLFCDRSGSPTVRMVPLSGIAGWQCDERWGDYDFLLTTEQGLVELKGVNTRYAIAFSHSLNRAASSLVDGHPEWMLPCIALYSQMCELMPAAWDEPLRPGTAEALPAIQLTAILTNLLGGRHERLTFGLSLLIHQLARILDPEGYIAAPRDLLMETLQRFESSDKQDPASVFLDAAAERRDPNCALAWSRVFALIAEFVGVAETLLSHSVDRDCLESFAAVQGAYAMFSQDVLPPSDGTSIESAPDLITELTRLQSLRDGGALSDDEFQLLKARLLAHL